MRFLFLILTILYAKYEPVFYCIDKHRLALRNIDDLRLLIVNTKTLKTSIIPYTSQKCKCNFNDKYFKLLKTSPKLQNAGVKEAKKIVLTIDMCPSHKKGFDKKLFSYLIKNDIPFCLFLTKRWAIKHKKEFNYIKKAKFITWGNHTATHPYTPHAPLNKNFALTPGYDLKKDVLEMEKFYLANGITPSVFFRFPGLVSDEKTLKIIKDLGLIVIGSNAWLAKGEKIKDNSIILVHGNKNEEKGVRLLLKEIKKIKITPINSSL